jgi:hypothetical protein
VRLWLDEVTTGGTLSAWWITKDTSEGMDTPGEGVELVSEVESTGGAIDFLLNRENTPKIRFRPAC